jgi:hypothetical protein
MARHIFAACGALAIAGVVLSAQSTTPSPSSTAAQPQAAAGTVTIQGCLKPNASAPMGSTPSGTTPGATGTSGAGAATQFLLTDAKMSSGSSSAPSGATGTAGAAAAKDDEYVLRAESASVNLAPHLNHQIEITGRLASSSSGSTATGTTPGATGATGTSSMSRPTVTVTAVKMIAAECK